MNKFLTVLQCLYANESNILSWAWHRSEKDVTAHLNLNWTTPPAPPHHESLCCCCAAGRVTIRDSTSLLTTYRATVNVVTTKINFCFNFYFTFYFNFYFNVYFNIYSILQIQKEFLSSFKTLVLVADQSLAANSTYVSKFRKSKIYKGKLGADFFRWATKN
jgi:hypothetical protein